MDIAWYNKGVLLLDTKKYEDALTCFDEAIKLNGTNGSYYSKRGLAKYQKNDTKSACDDFKKAVELGDATAQQYVDQYCK